MSTGHSVSLGSAGLTRITRPLKIPPKFSRLTRLTALLFLFLVNVEFTLNIFELGTPRVGRKSESSNQLCDSSDQYQTTMIYFWKYRRFRKKRNFDEKYCALNFQITHEVKEIEV